MEKELKYFDIEGSYGGNQKWFYDPIIRFCGCGAIVTCDICIYLNLFKNIKNLYPFNIDCLNKEDFIKFSKIIKKYLHPKINGISTLQLYIDGFKLYLEDIKCNEINIKPFSGVNCVDAAQKIVMSQIDKEIPIPFLLSFLAYSRHSGTFLANLEIDFVIIKSIFPLLHKFIIL